MRMYDMQGTLETSAEDWPITANTDNTAFVNATPQSVCSSVYVHLGQLSMSFLGLA